MKRFIIKLLLFTIPITLVLSLPFITLFTYKENFFSLDEVINKDSPYLIGYTYNENNYKYLKYKEIIENDRFKIWALGSSRILQFRKEMFNASFYNAGYTITSLMDFIPFLNSIPKEKYPDVLILSFDQWMFNEDYDQLELKLLDNHWSNSFTTFPKLNTILQVWKDIFMLKYKPIFMAKDDFRIGINARVNSVGFRKDGSMNYGTQIQKLLLNDSTAYDYEFSDTFLRIHNKSSRFITGNLFNNNTVPIIRQLLNFCSIYNIKLIAFLPPFAPDVYNVMMASGNYKYISQIEPQINLNINDFFFEFYDFTDPQTIESNNNEFLDGFHGSEKTYAKILLKMIDYDSILKEHIDISNLKEITFYSSNPLQLFPYY